MAKTLLIVLAASTAAAAVATPAAAAGRRAGHDAGPTRVTVRPWVQPGPAWPGWWSGSSWSGYGGAALHRPALRTTVYPYGPRGDGVRGYWYPGAIYGGCRYGWGACW
jgi:hypothetical protein